MFFATKFVETVINELSPRKFIESRTLYWKSCFAKRIYNGELNPIKDIESCKIGRIKKRTSCGGMQCAHIDQWNKVRGFDESMVQWGSEDYDLLLRMSHVCKTIWIGESRESIMLFHQPHYKSSDQIKADLEAQDKNKKIMSLSKQNPERIVNCDGWGGVLE